MYSLQYSTALQEAIFRAIDAEWNCDWYFGHTTTDIKEMDTSLLNKVYYYKTYWWGQKFYWQHGILGLLFRHDYRLFFMLLEQMPHGLFVFLLGSFFFPKKKYIYGLMGGMVKKLRLKPN